MNHEIGRLVAETLQLPTNAIEYHVSERLAVAFPDKAVVQGGDGLFNLEEYARAGGCTFTLDPVVYNQIITLWQRPRLEIFGDMMLPGMWNPSLPSPGATWNDKGLQERARNAWFAVRWEEHALDVLAMNWSDGFNHIYHYWILAETRAVAEDFLVAVCRWNNEIRGEVLVYDAGCWHKNEDLYRDIKGATFDNLVLKGDLKHTIHDDLAQFFASQEVYAQYGIPWKRGVLFVGPPGNGKTHAVKATVNALGKPCLYVKSFRAERRTDESCIGQVFEQARKSAPCLLVLEDLDALVTAHNRSFFLNELDGFAANLGVVTLATTNHPERLDPAILERPSRFDRKYPFDLPARPEREAYLGRWNADLQPALQLSAPVIEAIAADTEDFSFAYLKELFLSSMMCWLATPEAGAMDGIMPGQVATLRAQMGSTTTPDPEPEPGDAMARAMQSALRYGT